MFFLQKAFTAKLADLLYSIILFLMSNNSQLILVTSWMRSAVKGGKKPQQSDISLLATVAKKNLL